MILEHRTTSWDFKDLRANCPDISISNGKNNWRIQLKREYVYAMLCSPFSKTKLSFSASLKDIFCQSLKIFEKCGKKARILKKISFSVQSAKKVNKIVIKLINEILVACY